MSNFKVNFSVSGWLLLLIIPAFLIALFFFFRSPRRFRYNRNKVISLVLHCVVSTLCILILSGINFSYDIPNQENELVILVDASYSSANYKDRVNSLVHDVLTANEGRSNVSIVTFGYDQQVVLPMGQHSPESAYQKFLSAPSPDITATDIAGALTYVWDPTLDQSGGEDEAIIHYPDTAKILLISDGLETDRDAQSVAKRISMDGVQIDTSFYPASFKSDVWITNVSYPERKYSLGEEVSFEVTLKSTYQGKVSLKFTDMGEYSEQSDAHENLSLVLGEQTINFNYAFSTPGHHDLKFTIESEGDSLTENNLYYSYFEIEEYTSMLVVEKYKDESKQLVEKIKGSIDAEFLSVTVVNIESNELPKNMESIAMYDEVVLVNIAHKDMPNGFEDLLESYVNDYGGGLFTVGGVEKDGSGNVVMGKNPAGEDVPMAHSYNKEDMAGTTFEKMLPVNAVDYTPPVALAIIIDRSGSMDEDRGGMGLSPLDVAIKGAIDALDALSPRDQVGVLSLEDNYRVGLDMTSMKQKSKIVSAIRHIADGGGQGTRYAPSIDLACKTLNTIQGAERKHILFLSDSNPGDSFSQYNPIMQENYEKYGITITVMSIGSQLTQDMMNFAHNAGGEAYYITAGDVDKFSDFLKDDLGFDELSGAVPSEYHPTIMNHTLIVNGVNQIGLDRITMKGFFTTEAKGYGDVEVSLMADYVPLYAQWKYGEGKVGSFLCDLSGYWSQEVLESGEGSTIIHNVVTNLISQIAEVSENVFSAAILEDNYRTQVSIYGFDGQEESNKKLVAMVRGPEKNIEKFDLRDLSVSGNRFTFENRTAGVYEIIVVKVPENFNINSVNSFNDIPDSQVSGLIRAFRAFSYSKEYDSGADSFADGRGLLLSISTREIEEEADPTEKLVYDAEKLLSYFADVHIVYDPQLLFAILALVLGLLDIAIRKFKIRWLHEILRTRKQQKTQFGE